MSVSDRIIPDSFIAKKRRILAQLSVCAEEYKDLSPKGSVDEGIRSLVETINTLDGYVTTSSCAGRVSVFVEGRKAAGSVKDAGEESFAENPHEGPGVISNAESDYFGHTGMKGHGGHWLFVSHDPVQLQDGTGGGQRLSQLLGMRDESSVSVPPDMRYVRYTHFKFEPMILHILTASLEHAQIILSAALQAGFRESGALNLTSTATRPATPMVAVRSMGLGLESIIGFEIDGKPICNVSEDQLGTLLRISNSRFAENKERIQRFQSKLRETSSPGFLGNTACKKAGDMGEWEDVSLRRARKKAEGLRKRASVQATESQAKEAVEVKLSASHQGD